MVLVKGQLAPGGWEYRLHLDKDSGKDFHYRLDVLNRDMETGDRQNRTKLDNNNTQSALAFLMDLDLATNFELSQMPSLEAVFYAAGSIFFFVTDTFWKRGFIVRSFYAFNAMPDAEYCVGAFLLSLKQSLRHSRLSRKKKNLQGNHSIPLAGDFKSKVGLISFGMISRRTAELLRPYDHDILVFSTRLTAEKAARLGVRQASLEEIFATCDFVSRHIALSPETQGMTRGEHSRSIKPCATFLNTACGAVVKQDEMTEALRERPHLTAILDVTDPEPPADKDSFFKFPKGFISSHISGSHGHECRRLGQLAIDECRRYLNQEPLLSRITFEILASVA